MYTLVVVDDDFEVRSGLRDLFPWASLGFKVVACLSDGKQALRYVNHHPVDAILADVRMPFVTGLELARSVQRSGLATAVVLLSAYDQFEYARKGIDYGVKGYILKPTNRSELVRVFTRLRRELDARSGAAAEAGAGGASGYYERIVDAARRYVAENLDEATLKATAGIVGLSAYRLGKVHKEHAGENFSSYLGRTRMQKAKELVAGSAARIGEISEALGYSTEKSFARAFKRMFGVGPREYRYRGAAR